MALTLIANVDELAEPRVAVANYYIIHGKLRVGRIFESESTFAAESQRLWALSGVNDGPDVMCRADMAATLEEAQLAIDASWMQWLAWAGLSDACEQLNGVVTIEDLIPMSV